MVGRALEGAFGNTVVHAPTRSELDWTDLAAVQQAVTGHRLLIHLAWEMERPDTAAGEAPNVVMAENVWQACRAAGVERVVFASSIHADDATNAQWSPARRLSPARPPEPRGAYGSAKVHIEGLSVAHSHRLPAVCIRLGAVNEADVRPTGPFERAVWLAHADCRTAFQAALFAPLPAKHALFYAVSESPHRIHDLTNPLSWQPAGYRGETPPDITVD